jgi:hypothetical protein
MILCTGGLENAKKTGQKSKLKILKPGQIIRKNQNTAKKNSNKNWFQSSL